MMWPIWAVCLSCVQRGYLCHVYYEFDTHNTHTEYIKRKISSNLNVFIYTRNALVNEILLLFIWTHFEGHISSTFQVGLYVYEFTYILCVRTYDMWLSVKYTAPSNIEFSFEIKIKLMKNRLIPIKCRYHNQPKSFRLAKPKKNEEIEVCPSMAL